MLSSSRHLLRSGSAGFYYLCEARYGTPNAPFFGLFPKHRDGDSVLLAEDPESKLQHKQEEHDRQLRRKELLEQQQLQLKRRQQNVGIEEAFSVPVAQSHHHHETDGSLSLFDHESHGSVLTLSPPELRAACRYCKAAVALIGGIPNARDYLAGWAATITSNADLVNCALQSVPDEKNVEIFLDYIHGKNLSHNNNNTSSNKNNKEENVLLSRNELSSNNNNNSAELMVSERDRAAILRCFIIDVITACVRARGPSDLIGIEDLLVEQEKMQESEKQHDFGAEGKSKDKKRVTSSPWIDAVLQDQLLCGSGTSSAPTEHQPHVHALKQIFKFSRHQNISDKLVTDIFSVAMQEAEVNEEKFALLADGTAILHLNVLNINNPTSSPTH